MQLDKTQISIRERGVLENLDLSLHVVRDYFPQLVFMLLLGVVPIVALNHLLFGWMLQYEFGVDFPFRYLWVTILMSIIEAPCGTVFLTAFLGQAVFDEQPRVSKIVRQVVRSYARLLWCTWVLRGSLIAILIVLIADRDVNPALFVEILFLPAILFVAMTIRAFRPFINEIVILERNPLRTTSDTVPSIGRRSSMLHGPSMGDLIGRSLVTWFVATLLAFSFFGLCLFLSGVFLHDWRLGNICFRFCLPLALWSTIGFIAVTRFLGYLDVRIRQEGWEVEILVRAEAASLEKQMP